VAEGNGGGFIYCNIGSIPWQLQRKRIIIETRQKAVCGHWHQEITRHIGYRRELMVRRFFTFTDRVANDPALKLGPFFHQQTYEPAPLVPYTWQRTVCRKSLGALGMLWLVHWFALSLYP
jgi:hypothetical protein